jgi:hypothetical protein
VWKHLSESPRVCGSLLFYTRSCGVVKTGSLGGGGGRRLGANGKAGTTVGPHRKLDAASDDELAFLA